MPVQGCILPLPLACRLSPKQIIVATLCVVSSTKDVGALAKCGRILSAVLVCCLPHAVVVIIHLFALLVADRQMKGD